MNNDRFNSDLKHTLRILTGSCQGQIRQKKLFSLLLLLLLFLQSTQWVSKSILNDVIQQLGYRGGEGGFKWINKRKIVIINFSFYMLTETWHVIENPDNSYNSANFFHFAITISNPLTFQKCWLYSLHTLFDFLTQIWSKVLNLQHLRPFRSFNISIEIKSTQMWSNQLLEEIQVAPSTL